VPPPRRFPPPRSVERPPRASSSVTPTGRRSLLRGRAGRRSAASAPTAPWCRCTRTRCEAIRRHCHTPETAFASVGAVRPQLKPDRFPDEFLCLTPAILLSYPTEWLRDGSGPSPLNRWEISKANESQMQSMVSDICISGLWSLAEESRRCLKFSPFTSRRRRSSASVRELLN
jgi:hypothetical protein